MDEKAIIGVFAIFMICLMCLILPRGCTYDPVPVDMIDMTVGDLKEGEGGWIDMKEILENKKEVYGRGFRPDKPSWEEAFCIDRHRRLYARKDIHLKVADYPWQDANVEIEYYVYVYKSPQGLILTTYHHWTWKINKSFKTGDYERIKKIVDKTGDKDESPVKDFDYKEKEVEKAKGSWE